MSEANWGKLFLSIFLFEKNLIALVLGLTHWH